MFITLTSNPQEAISNSNIMRVKKFQRELESAEGRASEAESCLNSFRSRQRVFAQAESRCVWQYSTIEQAKANSFFIGLRDYSYTITEFFVLRNETRFFKISFC